MGFFACSSVAPAADNCDMGYTLLPRRRCRAVMPIRKTGSIMVAQRTARLSRARVHFKKTTFAPAFGLWAGLLSVLSVDTEPALSQAVAPPPDTAIPTIRMQRFDVHFETAESTEVSSVELWFTMDCGASWNRSELDPSWTRSPLPFVAPKEGLYGFFVIVNNQAGSSSLKPEAGTPPQQWCFVDWTPPLVQVHVAEKDKNFVSTRRIALKWTAYDTHLIDRPIALYYMFADQRLWVPIEQNLPNSGRYDWRVPDSVSGRLVLKLAVTDRGGHVVERFSEPLNIEAAKPAAASRPADPAPVAARTVAVANRPMETVVVEQTPPKPAPSSPVTVRSVAVERPESRQAELATHESVSIGQVDSPKRIPIEVRERRTFKQVEDVPAISVGRVPTTVKAAVEVAGTRAVAVERANQPVASRFSGDSARAKKLYEAGTWHRLRGEFAVATLRYREALQADPACHEARQDLAGLLYIQGKYAESAKTYGEVLSQAPNHRGALRGLALASVACRDYATAKGSLMRLVALDDADGQAWLDLGDVSFLVGDRSGARDFWTKAAGTGQSAEVVDKAQKRLATYPPLPLGAQ